MTIYLDAAKWYPPDRKRPQRANDYWSCMWTDGSIDDLHRFAKSIRLQRRRFQNKLNFPHYTLIPTERNMALLRGAKQMSLRDFLNKRTSGRIHKRGVETVNT